MKRSRAAGRMSLRSEGLVLAFSILAVARAVSTTNATDVVAAVSALHEAGMRRDVAAMKPLYADDYFHTNPDGSLMQLADVLASYRGQPQMTFSSEDVAERKVLVHGCLAIVTERIALHGKTAGGDPFVSKFRVTYVLERHGSGWKFVNSHASSLGVDANPAVSPSPTSRNSSKGVPCSD